MTATANPMVTGIVIDRQHTDGKTGDGKVWNRYGFQIAGADGKHWYSTFDQPAWDQLEKGKAFQVWYSEKDNPSGGAPFRNIQWWKEVDLEEQESSVTEIVQKANNRDEWYAWNLAYSDAVHLHGPLTADSMSLELSWIEEIAVAMYSKRMAGPPATIPQEAPVVAIQPPLEGELGQRPVMNQVAALRESVNTWNHDHPDEAIATKAILKGLDFFFGIKTQSADDGVALLAPDQLLMMKGWIAKGEYFSRMENTKEEAPW